MKANDLYIMHYGVGHDKGGHSGRYPWGSGENPYGGKNKFNGLKGEMHRSKFATKVKALEIARSGETQLHRQKITSFITANLENYPGVQKYKKKYGSVQDFILDPSKEAKKDREEYYKYILKNDWETKIELDGLRMINSDYNKKANSLIEAYGKYFDLNDLYKDSFERNIARNELNSQIRSFINQYYGKYTEDKSDIEILDDLMLQRYT